MRRVLESRLAAAGMLGMILLAASAGGALAITVINPPPHNFHITYICAKRKSGILYQTTRHCKHPLNLQGPPGPPGSQGPPGPQGTGGPQGPAATSFWGDVSQSGSFTATGGSLQSYMQHPYTGQYIVTFSQPINKCAEEATLNDVTGQVGYTGTIDVYVEPNIPWQMYVMTYNSSGNFQDEAFDLAVFC